MRDISLPETTSEALNTIPTGVVKASQEFFAGQGGREFAVPVAQISGFTVFKVADLRSKRDGGVSISSDDTAEIIQVFSECAHGIQGVADSPMASSVDANAIGDRIRNLSKLKEIFDQIVGAISDVDLDKVMDLIAMISKIVAAFG